MSAEAEFQLHMLIPRRCMPDTCLARCGEAGRPRAPPAVEPSDPSQSVEWNISVGCNSADTVDRSAESSVARQLE